MFHSFIHDIIQPKLFFAAPCTDGNTTPKVPLGMTRLSADECTAIILTSFNYYDIELRVRH